MVGAERAEIIEDTVGVTEGSPVGSAAMLESLAPVICGDAEVIMLPKDRASAIRVGSDSSTGMVTVLGGGSSTPAACACELCEEC